MGSGFFIPFKLLLEATEGCSCCLLLVWELPPPFPQGSHPKDPPGPCWWSDPFPLCQLQPVDPHNSMEEPEDFTPSPAWTCARCYPCSTAPGYPWQCHPRDHPGTFPACLSCSLSTGGFFSCHPGPSSIQSLCPAPASSPNSQPLLPCSRTWQH